MVTIDARLGKWLAFGLLVSVAINLFLGGLMAGRIFGHRAPYLATERFAERPGERIGERPGGALIQRMIAQLPPGERAKFESAIGERRRDIMAAGAAAREARLKIRDVLQAEKFDRAALDAAFTDLRNDNLAFQKSLHDAIGTAIERLSPEARQSLADLRPGRGTP